MALREPSAHFSLGGPAWGSVERTSCRTDRGESSVQAQLSQWWQQLEFITGFTAPGASRAFIEEGALITPISEVNHSDWLFAQGHPPVRGRPQSLNHYLELTSIVTRCGVGASPAFPRASECPCVPRVVGPDVL